MREWVYIVVILSLVVLLLFQFLKSPNIVTQEIIVRDTVITYVPIHIEQQGKITYKYKYIYRYDSLQTNTVIVNSEIDSTRFVSCVDTLVNKTQVDVCYEYPENIFRINVNQLPDTLIKYTVIEKPLLNVPSSIGTQKDDWYKIGGAFLFGVLVGGILIK